MTTSTVRPLLALNSDGAVARTCDTGTMATFVVAHGAWSAGWAWKKMHPVLAELGHQLFTPTWTGIGERRHLATPEVGLGTHIEDFVGHMEAEDHSDVIVIAHSYGGMVATGAMGRIAERVRRIIYLDAVLPDAGCSFFDIIDPRAAAAVLNSTDEHGDGWRVPSNPMPPDTSDVDMEWITPRRVPQPLRTFTEPTPHGVDDIVVPRAYIYCLRVGPGDMFGPFAARARSDASWEYREIDASHSPNITAPHDLAEVLVDLINA